MDYKFKLNHSESVNPFWPDPEFPARIGEDLFLSIETVKTHIEHIYDKLQVNNREEALAEALERRLI